MGPLALAYDTAYAFPQLQILDILFNDSFGTLATPALMTQITILHVLGIFVTGCFHDNFPLEFYGIFTVWSVAWFVI